MISISSLLRNHKYTSQNGQNPEPFCKQHCLNWPSLFHSYSVLTCAAPRGCLGQSESPVDRGFPPVRRCTAAGAPQSLNYGMLLSCAFPHAPSAYHPPSDHRLCEETRKWEKVNQVSKVSRLKRKKQKPYCDFFTQRFSTYETNERQIRQDLTYEWNNYTMFRS